MSLKSIGIRASKKEIDMYIDDGDVGIEYKNVLLEVKKDEAPEGPENIIKKHLSINADTISMKQKVTATDGNIKI